MKVLLLCPKAFETMEFSVFIDVLGWARESFGNDIHVHTCGFGKHVISTFNVSVQMDVLIDEVDVNDSNFALELAPMHLENSIITGIKIA